mmetsp:Transcript_78255/g.138170  ORF Transcript_78255/g.138170 Transcript_78255/m.138170 type:complete len:229 (-) Transcript_78255:1000-1686(-)
MRPGIGTWPWPWPWAVGCAPPGLPWPLHTPVSSPPWQSASPLSYCVAMPGLASAVAWGLQAWPCWCSGAQQSRHATSAQTGQVVGQQMLNDLPGRSQRTEGRSCGRGCVAPGIGEVGEKAVPHYSAYMSTALQHTHSAAVHERVQLLPALRPMGRSAEADGSHDHMQPPRSVRRRGHQRGHLIIVNHRIRQRVGAGVKDPGQQPLGQHRDQRQTICRCVRKQRSLWGG